MNFMPCAGRLEAKVTSAVINTALATSFDHNPEDHTVFNTLTYNVHDRVAYVEFATPEKLNSITEQRLDELAQVVETVRSDAQVRALTITGQGRAFCVGLDLTLLKKAFYDIGYFENTIRKLSGVLTGFESLPVPVIAAVNGVARAGGFEIALACDLMIVADEAKIGDNHTQVGVMPGGGCMHRLRRRLGEQRAKDLIWSARWLNGPEAVAWGLALRHAPLAQLKSATEELLSEIRHRPRECLGAIKRTMQAGLDVDLATAIEIELKNFVDYMGGQPFGREGYEASLEGRAPSWY
jgi:enoyl-CoA hydratase/carnithine racemase